MEFIIWIILIVVFCVIEATTFNLVTIWFAFGSAVGLIMSVIGFDVTAQIWAFVIASVLLLAVTRPIVKKKFKTRDEKTNADRIIGQTGIVTEEISADKFAGKVKALGQEWSAVSKSGSLLEEGVKVKILSMEGVKLIVEKEEE